jgi:hypothetical protein
MCDSLLPAVALLPEVCSIRSDDGIQFSLHTIDPVPKVLMIHRNWNLKHSSRASHHIDSARDRLHTRSVFFGRGHFCSFRWLPAALLYRQTSESLASASFLTLSVWDRSASLSSSRIDENSESSVVATAFVHSSPCDLSDDEMAQTSHSNMPKDRS